MRMRALAANSRASASVSPSMEMRPVSMKRMLPSALTFELLVTTCSRAMSSVKPRAVMKRARLSVSPTPMR